MRCKYYTDEKQTYGRRRDSPKNYFSQGTTLRTSNHIKDKLFKGAFQCEQFKRRTTPDSRDAGYLMLLKLRLLFRSLFNRNTVFQSIALIFCLLFGLALLLSTQSAGDGLWFWYSTFLR